MILLAFVGLPYSSLPALAAETAEAAQGDDSVFSVAGGFEQVAVTDFAGTITVRSGEEYGVLYEGEEELRPSFSCEEKVLSIEGVVPAQSKEQSSETEEPEAEDPEAEEPEAALCSLVITIPAGTRLETVNIEKAGTVILTDLTVGSVVLKNITGDIYCKNVSLNQGDMQSESGNIQISEGSFHSLYLDCGRGNVYVSAAQGLPRCRVTASAEQGTVTVSGSVKGRTFRQNGNGRRYLTINAAEGNVVLLY